MTAAEQKAEELDLLTASLARRMRLLVDCENVAPQTLEVARKFLLDQRRAMVADPDGLASVPRQAPVVEDLPFTDPE